MYEIFYRHIEKWKRFFNCHGTDDPCQKVGRVIIEDFRFPKDGLDLVQTYPGSQMPGDQTAGLPDHLFWVLAGLSQWEVTGLRSSDTAADMLANYVQTGKVGVIRILLNM